MNIAPARFCNKYQVTKWLLAAVLVLSLFSYGGVSVTQWKPQIYHTALQVNSTHPVKKSVTYPCSFNQPCTATCFGDVGLVKKLSDRHSLLAKIQLIKHAVPYIAVRASTLIHHKIISDTTADSPAILV